MDIKKIIYKIARKGKWIFSFYFFQYFRIVKYIFLSSCNNIQGKPIVNQPVLIAGKGCVYFGDKVTVGIIQSPFYYSGYVYIDARKECSCIKFGDNVWINNSCVFISEGVGIEIGRNTLFGVNCEVIDSDFHDLDPEKRMSGLPETAKVKIGENVFIGSNVKILKGVDIGDNSVIGNGSVVTKSIPINVIAGGNPARILKYL